LIEVRRVLADEWETLRETRLRALADAPLDEFLQLHEGRGRQAQMHEALRRVDAAAEGRGVRDVLIARDSNGVARSGCYLVHDRRYTYYLLSATDGQVRGSGAAVVWEAVKRAAARGNSFDFEGSVLPHVEPFVRSFGGNPTPYSVVRHTPSRGQRAERALKRTVRSLTRR